jgi:hypothetical protein
MPRMPQITRITPRASRWRIATSQTENENSRSGRYSKYPGRLFLSNDSWRLRHSIAHGAIGVICGIRVKAVVVLVLPFWFCRSGFAVLVLSF